MNSHKLIIAALLFMMACAPGNARSDDESGCIRARQMNAVGDRYLTCHDLRTALRKKEQANKQARDQEFCRALDRKLLEEIENNETYQHHNKERHVEILEELLRESTLSGIPSPHPDRCP